MTQKIVQNYEKYPYIIKNTCFFKKKRLTKSEDRIY